MTRIITRKEAQGLGLKHYFTGRPCPHGHIAKRFVSSMTCSKCYKKKPKGIKVHNHPFCSLWKAAKSSENRKEFKIKFPGQHSAAHKRGLMASLCSHMPPPKTRGVWSVCTLWKVAQNYTTLTEFMSAHSGGYDYALKMGLVKLVSAHMERHMSDYDAAYIWGFWRDGELFCKFGVTSQRLGETRIKHVTDRGRLPVDFVILAKSSRALEWEAKVKFIGKTANLGRFSGSTEFRQLGNSQLTEAYEVLHEYAD